MNAGDRIEARYTLRREGFALDVDIDLPMRGITGLFGSSGAGKTTLLRCIAGLERAEGRLVVAGQTWQDETTFLSVQDRAVGYVFQEPRLFDHLSVSDNIGYGRRRRGGGAAVDDIVELLGLGGLLERRPGDLSGGEAQRVAIARALSCAPRFVLMDEPLAALDRARRDEILPYLDRLHGESRVPIVYVSHNLDEICRLCDHLVVIDRGRVAANGELQSVLVDFDVPGLGGDDAGTVIDGTVAAVDAADGVVHIAVAAGEFVVPAAGIGVGAALRLRIRASDVSLCRARPADSTILNILPARIESIRPVGQGSAVVRLQLGGDRLVAQVTQRSVRQLDLKEGDEVYAQIKSIAVRHSQTA